MKNKERKAQKNNSTGALFNYTVDSFEDLYLYAWAAMLTGSGLAVVLFLFVVYVL